MLILMNWMGTVPRFLFFPLLFIVGKEVTGQARERTYYADAGTYAEFEFQHSYLTIINAGTVIAANNGFEFSPELSVYKFWNRDYSELGIGLRPALKYYPIVKGNYLFFTEVKGGIMYMFPEYQNTAVDFTFHGGVGVKIKLTGQSALTVGAGYDHFSNGREEGNVTNPTWDGAGGCLGFVYML